MNTAPALDAEMIAWDASGPADSGTSTAPREFTASDGCYRLSIQGVVLEIDRLRRERGTLSGELVVRCTLPGARPVDELGTISAADFSLSAQRSRQERAGLLARRSGNEAVDWFGLLEELCLKVIQAERTGEPAVHLRDVPRAAPDASIEIIPGLPLLREHPTIWFGDGGSLKSFLALYHAGSLTQRGIRCGYFDWECSASDHRERLEYLFGPSMPDVLYCRCDRPLTAEADRLARIIRENEIAYAVLDSVAFACDGPPEAAEVAGAYFRALRSLRVGSLNLAHVTKAEDGDRRPFGSTFWFNGSRAVWFLKRATDSPDPGRLDLACFNRKINLGPLAPAVGIEVEFGADRLRLHRRDASQMQDFAAKLPVWQRMVSALRAGPMTQAALARELDVSGEAVRKASKRATNTFTHVEGADGITRIALVERPNR